jgi:hypothetical protein
MPPIEEVLGSPRCPPLRSPRDYRDPEGPLIQVVSLLLSGFSYPWITDVLSVAISYLPGSLIVEWMAVLL